MPKRAISVTLDIENVTWLKGRAGSSRFRSVSDVVNQLVMDARSGGRLVKPHSVVGTIDIDASDPLLLTADAAVRRLYDAALTRPLMLRDKRVDNTPSARARRRAKRRG